MAKYTKQQLNKLADFGCVLCQVLGYGKTASELHHVRRFGDLRKNSPVLPLCWQHHRGQYGIHGLGRKGFEKFYAMTEDDLLIFLENNIKNLR